MSAFTRRSGYTRRTPPGTAADFLNADNNVTYLPPGLGDERLGLVSDPAYQALVPWNIEHRSPPSGILKIIGMPPGGQTIIDDHRLGGDVMSPFGDPWDWVGGNPTSGIYVIDNVPLGPHKIEVISPLGEVKTWTAQNIVETTFFNRFNLSTGLSPAGSVVNEINYTTQPGTPLGILKITGMPPGGGIDIDGADFNTAGKGFAIGWVGGTPASGVYVLAAVPVGNHSIELQSSDGTKKTWPAQAIVATTPYQFDIATGRAPAGAVVNEIDWTRQPVASQDNVNLPSYTITLTPATATSTAGEDISQEYNIVTATTGNGTVLDLTLSVVAPGLVVAGIQSQLDKTTLKSGESAKLTLTGTKDTPPGSLSFSVSAVSASVAGSMAVTKLAPGILVVPQSVVEENKDDEEGGVSTPMIIGGVALLAIGAFVVLRMTRKAPEPPRGNPRKKRRSLKAR